MGAAQFAVRSSGTTVADAFAAAKDAAFYEHGHGGYTGTIAEKKTFADFGPIPAGFTVGEFVTTLESFASGRPPGVDGPRHVDLVARLVAAVPPDVLGRMAEAFDDKWGPAVAVQLPTNAKSTRTKSREWLFCGWASE